MISRLTSGTRTELRFRSLSPRSQIPYGTAIQSKYFGTITVVLGDARLTSSTNDCSRAIAGAWLIMIKDPGGDRSSSLPRVVVVLNWMEELKTRVR